MRLVCLLFLFVVTYSGRLMAQTVDSPNGDIRIEFSSVERLNYLEGTPMYAVSYKGKPFLLPSRLGFDVLGTAEIKSFLKVTDVLRDERRSTWKQLGEVLKRVGDGLNFTTSQGDVIRPLYDIHRQRYVVYWNLVETD